ncbi:hypothetical protein BDV19DRAFT_386255 [Aspergillus venezuelensis]
MKWNQIRFSRNGAMKGYAASAASLIRHAIPQSTPTSPRPATTPSEQGKQTVSAKSPAPKAQSTPSNSSLSTPGPIRQRSAFSRKLSGISPAQHNQPVPGADAGSPTHHHSPYPYPSHPRSATPRRTSDGSYKIHKAYDDKCNELDAVSGRLQVSESANGLLRRHMKDLQKRHAALWKHLAEREDEVGHLKNLGARELPEEASPDENQEQRIEELRREVKNLKAQVEARHTEGNYTFLFFMRCDLFKTRRFMILDEFLLSVNIDRLPSSCSVR